MPRGSTRTNTEPDFTEQKIFRKPGHTGTNLDITIYYFIFYAVLFSTTETPQTWLWTKRLRRGVYGVDRVNRLVPAVAID